MENHAENVSSIVLAPFWFGKNPNSNCVQEILLNIRFWKRITKNSLKSQLHFFFRTQSFLMDKVIEKKESGTSEQLLFILQNKFRKIY